MAQSDSIDPKSTDNRKPPNVAWMSLVLILAVIIGVIVWSVFAKIDVSVKASGKVIPSLRLQVIQHFEGGIIKKINVREGQVVKKGQVLVQLDDTRFKVAYEENLAKYYVIQGEIARLTAEATGNKEIEFTTGFKAKHPNIVAIQKKLFNANRRALAAELTTLKKSYDLTQRELKIILPLVKERVMSEVDKIKLDRQLNTLKGKMQEKIALTRSKAQSELTRLLAEKAVLEKKIIADRDRLQRSSIRAPIDGIVNKVYVTTIGEVVHSGAKILEMVPVEPKLTIRVQVPPRDIAFIGKGQEATVYVSAYTYSTYGFLKAKVLNVSADTITDKDGNTYYEVLLVTDKNYLGTKEKPLRIFPGMDVIVHIITDQRTVFQYMTKPFYDVYRDALRER